MADPAAPAEATRQEPEPFRFRHLVVVPVAAWLVAALFVGLLGAWSVLARTYYAPDEPQHVDMVLALIDEPRWPGVADRMLGTRVADSLVPAGFSDTGSPFERNREAVTTEDAIPRGQRPAYADFGADEPTEWINAVPQHPPLYYAVGAVALWAAPGHEHWAFDRVVGFLRLLNIVIVAPLPLLAYAGARRLTAPAVGVAAAAGAGHSRDGVAAAAGAGHSRVALAAPVALLGVPQLTHIGSTVNNDNLLITLVGLLTVLLVYVATGDTTRRTALVVGVVGALALLTKGFALFLPLWIASAYVLAWARRGLPAWRPPLVAAVVALAVAGVGGGWWWLRNVVVYRTIQPTPGPLPAAEAGFEPRFVDWLEPAWSFLVARYWGSFGWVDISLHPLYIDRAAWTLGILLALGFVFRRAADRWWRADLVLLILPTVLILVIAMYGSWSTYTYAGRITGMQGRYLLPGVVGLAIVVAVGLGSVLRGRLGGLGALLLLGAAARFQYLAAVVVLYWYYGDRDAPSLRASIEAMLAWQPWPPALVWVGLGLAGAAAVASGVALLVTAVQAWRYGAVPAAERAASTPAADSMRSTSR